MLRTLPCTILPILNNTIEEHLILRDRDERSLIFELWNGLNESDGESLRNLKEEQNFFKQLIHTF